MIKVYAGIASVGFLVLASVSGCSSADTPDEGGGGTSSSTAGKGTTSGGSTVLPMGGTTSDAGTSSSAAGTASPTAGTAATTGGMSSGGTGSGTGGAVSAACKGIKTGMACMPEGTDCPGLACGLADSGARACKCMGTWMCASCDYSASPFKDKPADIMKCTGVEADKVTCTEKGKVCDGAAGGEVCACWTDDEGALIWDCDKPPTTWAAAAP
jgi:hypothetical protein